ncbi:MAG TPA: TetR/AcrR family transcriptional regulator [Solirubrobacterales bacterium]|nr:TetR/AcrR family transcriptional regulator [Solirubrobacterales bacterium]
MAKLPDHLQGSPMGAERISREVLALHQRDAVLERVTEVFAKRGYAGTTVEDLLATGKVGVGNFYELFEGKEDCFLAAFERVVSRAREQISAAAVQGGDWDASAYLALSGALTFILAEPLAARLALIEAQGAGPEAMARHDAMLEESIVRLAEGRRHHPDAQLLPNFEQAAIAGLAFYLQQCLLESRRHTHAELLAETAALVLEPIVGSARLSRLRREHGTG